MKKLKDKSKLKSEQITIRVTKKQKALFASNPYTHTQLIRNLISKGGVYCV